MTSCAAIEQNWLGASFVRNPHFICRDESFLTEQEMHLIGKCGECAICNDASENASQYFIALSCGHCFHAHCALMWFARSHSNHCPICRRNSAAIVPTALLPLPWQMLTHSGSIDQLPCAICRRVDDVGWLHLACGHSFHRQCFQDWCCRRKVCPLDNSFPIYVPKQ